MTSSNTRVLSYIENSLDVCMLPGLEMLKKMVRRHPGDLQKKKMVWVLLHFVTSGILSTEQTSAVGALGLTAQLYSLL